MKKERPLKDQNLLKHLIATVAIGVILLLAGLIMIFRVRDQYRSSIIDEAQADAKAYGKYLETAMKAKYLTDDLLDQRLEGGMRAAAMLWPEQEISGTLMGALGLDELYRYNAKGVIIASGSGKYLGWSSYPGHPVQAFLDSKEAFLIEEIREDTESDLYYKYAYIRLSDGGFLQGGILADSIVKLEEEFLVEDLLRDMMNRNSLRITEAAFINQDSQIQVAGSTPEKVRELLTPAALQAIERGDAYLWEQPGDFLQVQIPIIAGGIYAGTLLLQYSLEGTQGVTMSIFITGFFALGLILLVLGLALRASYKGQKNLLFLAYHKPLTGLPNKQAFREFMKRPENRSEAPGEHGMILVNYRNFKGTNLAYGHSYGDRMIQKLGQALRDFQAEDSSLYHLTGDRFLLVLRNYGDKKALEGLVKNLLLELEEALASIAMGCSLGILEYMSARHDPDTLIRYGELAARAADPEIPFSYAFFNNTMNDALDREVAIEQELRMLLQGDQDAPSFYLDYQPLYEGKTLQIHGFEALARLHSPRLGQIPPDEFIAAAERSQLINPLGNLILKMAAAFSRDLRNPRLRTHINVSTLQILREDFPATFFRIIRREGAHPQELGIELTESVFAESHQVLNRRLQPFRKEGVLISLDDFGTGYSSFSREEDLGADHLKIDKSFLDRLLEKPKEKSILGDMISMAHKLGYQVVAEGVEVRQQLDYLQEAGCDYLQGFLLSRPLSREQALKAAYDAVELESI